MDQLTEDEKRLLLQVLDGVILEAWKKFSMTEGEQKEVLRSLCHKLAGLGLHIIDILQPPIVH